jgi:hypothetical protein
MKTLKNTILVMITLMGGFNLADAQTGNKAYEDNMKLVDSVLVGGSYQHIYAIYSGDINQDGFVDIFDIPEFTTVAESEFPYGYLPSDLNGDGFVDIFDIPALATNIENQVYVHRPF